MTVKAKTKNVGISVKKLRPYVNLVRGKKAIDALNILAYMNSSSSETLIELIKSAIANAESSQYGDRDELIISTIYADNLQLFEDGEQELGEELELLIDLNHTYMLS